MEPNEKDTLAVFADPDNWEQLTPNIMVMHDIEGKIAKATGNTVYLDAVAKIKEVIAVAERLGWLKPDRQHGWTMCGAAVEKTLLMALDKNELKRFGG